MMPVKLMFRFWKVLHPQAGGLTVVCLGVPTNQDSGLEYD